MTNINCSKNCIYQQDGKCGYDHVLPQKLQISNFCDTDCAYCVTKNPASGTAEHSCKTS